MWKKYFDNHFFFFILVILVIIAGFFSYYRFMVKNDYVVGYEGVCDSATEKCFIGCNDDACTDKYYYTKMQKYAPDLYTECGKDITDCEAASICLPDDRKCSVTYCNSEIDGSDVCSVVGESLENNNINNTNI